MSGKETRQKKATALRYNRLENDAPIIAASGRGEVAENIIAIAEKAGIPIREDADLVEILSTIPVGEEIPIELYQAVAEVLTFVYALNKK